MTVENPYVTNNERRCVLLQDTLPSRTACGRLVDQLAYYVGFDPPVCEGCRAAVERYIQQLDPSYVREQFR